MTVQMGCKKLKRPKFRFLGSFRKTLKSRFYTYCHSRQVCSAIAKTALQGWLKR